MELETFNKLQFEVFDFYEKAKEAFCSRYSGEPIAFAMDDVQLTIAYSSDNDDGWIDYDINTFLLKDFHNKEDFFRRLREEAALRAGERAARKRKEAEEEMLNRLRCFKMNTPEQKLAVFNRLKEELGL